MNEAAIEKLGPLAAARKTALLTQDDMAKRLGMGKPAIIGFEKNPETTPLGVLGRWYLNVNTDGKAIIKRYLADFFCGIE